MNERGVNERRFSGILAGFTILSLGVALTFFLLMREIDNRAEAVRRESQARADALQRQTTRTAAALEQQREAVAARIERERVRHAQLLCRELDEHYHDSRQVIVVLTETQSAREQALGFLHRPGCTR